MIFLLSLACAITTYYQQAQLAQKAAREGPLTLCGNLLCTPAQKYGAQMEELAEKQKTAVLVAAFTWVGFARPDLFMLAWKKVKEEVKKDGPT